MFYTLWPEGAAPNPRFSWNNISDNKPWGNQTVDDVSVFFWLQEEPWNTPAIVMLAAGNKPYLHWHPEDINFVGGPSDWIDTSDNEPWNQPGGVCVPDPHTT